MKKFLATFKEEVYKPTVAMGKGEYDKAIEIQSKSLTSKDPNTVLASRILIAKCYDWKGDLPNSYENAIKALENKPNDFEMLYIVTKYWFECLFR